MSFLLTNITSFSNSSQNSSESASSKPLPYHAEIFYFLITIPLFLLYIFIFLVFIIAREKITIHSLFKIQTLPLGFIYTIANLNLYGTPKSIYDVSTFCKFMTNIRSIVFIIILGVQTFQMLFTLASLYWTSFVEKYNKTISLCLHILCHVMWIIMVLLGINGSSYERNMALGLCKFKNPKVTLYRTILYIVYAVMYLMGFILMVHKVRSNLSKVNDETMFMKYERSFRKYFWGLVLYLVSYLSITVMMTLEGFTEIKVSFNTTYGAFMWYLRVISQSLVPVVASWLNCVTSGKINTMRNKICGTKQLRSESVELFKQYDSYNDNTNGLEQTTEEMHL